MRERLDGNGQGTSFHPLASPNQIDANRCSAVCRIMRWSSHSEITVVRGPQSTFESRSSDFTLRSFLARNADYPRMSDSPHGKWAGSISKFGYHKWNMSFLACGDAQTARTLDELVGDPSAINDRG
jgi:hypothetical protein